MKKKPFILIVSSLIIFAIISALITYGMIQSTINKKLELSQSGEKIISSGEEEIEILKPIPGIDVNGTFNENSITWIEQAYQEGQTKIEYYKISGLVNKEVENKINDKLKEAAFKNFDPNKIDKIRLSVYQNIYASFSNVISVRTIIDIYDIEGNTKHKYETNDLNFELVNGEEIKFKDLFVDEKAMTQLMFSEFYEDEAWSKQWEKETDFWNGEHYEFNEELWKAPILNIDEDKIIEKVNRYKNLNINSFIFTPKYVSTEVRLSSGESEYLYLAFDSIPDTIAIYNRYLTDEKIYEDESIGRKNVINLANINMDSSICYYAYKNDKATNFFVDIQVYSDMYDEEYEKEEKAKEHIVRLAKQELVEFERKAQAEPDKYFVYIKSYRILDSLSEVFAVSEIGGEYYSDISKKDDLYQKLIDLYTGVDYEIAENLYINLEKEENAYISGDRTFNDTKYSFKAMKKIETVEDLFVDGFEYESALKDEFNKIWLQETGNYLVGEELEEQFRQTEFSYATKWVQQTEETIVIEVYNDILGYYKDKYSNFKNSNIFIPLSAFNPEDLAI